MTIFFASLDGRFIKLELNFMSREFDKKSQCFNIFGGAFDNNNNIRLKFRSSRSEVFCKKGALTDFAKFTGKHLCQSFFFDKVAGLRSATLFKKRLWRRCFPVNFAKFLRTPFPLMVNSGK